MTEKELIEAHWNSDNNRLVLEMSDWCGCFCCIEIYSPKDIVEWIDNGTTALCPRCGVDSVIGNFYDYNVNKDFLEAMNVRWFQTGVIYNSAVMAAAMKKLND